MFRLTLNTIAILFLSCTHVLCQHLNFKRFSDEVLSSSYVYSVFQDSRGFIWFSTDRGICRYDGYGFTKYQINDGLADNEVFNFFEDSQHRIWFLTLNGRVSYYKNGVFENSNSDPALAALDSKTFIADMAEDSLGGVWFLVGGRELIKYSRDRQVQRFPVESMKTHYTHGLLFSSRNKLMILSDGPLAQLTLNDSLTSIVKQETLPFLWDNVDGIGSGYPQHSVVTDDTFYMNDQNQVYEATLSNKQFTLFYKRAQVNERVLNVLQDDRYVWICTSNGVVPYRRDTHQFLPPMLRGHQVSGVLRDTEGGYWFTTFGSGVFYSSTFDIYALTEKDGGLVNDRVTCLLDGQDGRIWVGYESGGMVSFIEGGHVHHHRLVLPVLSDLSHVLAMHKGQDAIWIVTRVGLFRHRENKTEVLPSFFFKNVAELNDTLWVGGARGIAAIAKKAFEHFKTSGESLRASDMTGQNRAPDLKPYIGFKKPGLRVRGIFRDGRSVMWLAADQGFFKIAHNTSTAIALGFSDDRFYVNSATEMQDGTLVLTTNIQGVILLKNDNVNLRIGTREGLSSNVCNKAAVDDRGTIWVGTDNGLNKITGYPDKPVVEYFTTNDGLLSNVVVDLVAKGDTVWVATNNGINYFHRDRLKKKTVPPIMIIDGITMHGRPVDGALDKPVLFRHDQNDVSIGYSGLSYNSAGDVLYRYKMHAEDPWRYTHNTSVYLPQLPPDHYQFTVASKTSFSGWSDEAVLAFVINKPFWQTNWFIIMAVLSGALAVVLGVSLYVRTQNKKAEWKHRATISELRSLRAQMNPHFLFNALNGIRAAMMKHDIDKAEEYLARFSKLMRQILDHSDKATVSVTDEIQTLVNYLNIEQLRESSPFQYQIDVATEVDPYTTEIPAMIIQPFVENAIWHAFRHQRTDRINQLRIAFWLDGDGRMVITIEDNGIGRKNAQALHHHADHRSKGIQLVRERIAILNARNAQVIELSIKDVDSDDAFPGTSVTLKIPLL